MIRVGDSVPDFTAAASNGATVRLSDYRGRYVVLYFFPKAFTRVCTVETKRFGEVHAEIQKLGGEVLGVSVDDAETLQRFAGSMCSPFTMVSDADRAISKGCGVLWPLVRIDRRVTLLIDPAGVVRGVFHHELQAERHIQDALAMLRQLKQGGANA